MKIIALEEHVATPEFLRATQANTGLPNGYMAAIQKKMADLGDGRIADMDAAGIDIQVLSLTAIGMESLEAADATSVARDANNTIFQAVQEHPDRFAGFATLGMKEPEKAEEEFRRCVTKLGFKGAMINGTTDGLFLDHPSFQPILEVAQELNVPIYLHPAPPPKAVNDAYFSGLPHGYGEMLAVSAWGWHAETGLHALRMIVSGVFDRFPNLKIIIGHMGENLPFSIARADSKLARNAKYLQRPVIEYFHSNFYITTSGYFTIPPFLNALMVCGADHLMFSVDYPYSANKDGVEFLKSLPVSSIDLEKIAHGNAEALLKL